MSLKLLQAATELKERHGIENVVVIDSPYLTAPPAQLKELLPNVAAVVFADVCKEGQHPFAGFVTSLNNEGLLPSLWRCIGAQKTYNPLGCKITFLSTDDVVNAVVGTQTKK